MKDWDGRHGFFKAEATKDLLADAEVRGVLAAFLGEDPVCLIFLRSWAQGQHVDAVIEALALAVQLGADRVAVALPGRAWSLDDPIPPVLDGIGDLRQRVLVIDEADGTVHPPRVLSSAHAFDIDGTGPKPRVRWGAPITATGATGLISEALEIWVRERAIWDHLSDDALARRAAQCTASGHLVAVAPVVARRLGLCLT